MVDTEVVFRVSVSHCRFEYAVRGIKRIVRTGTRAAPFAGIVEFNVTSVTRACEKRLTESLPVPETYRPHPTDEAIVELVEPIQEACSPIERLFVVEPKFPLPYSGQFYRRSGPTPKLISDSVAELRKLCMQTEPERRHEVHSVWFDYVLGDNKWHWRTRE
jgi:hypothetical protein